jgi:hypothetical protein
VPIGERYDYCVGVWEGEISTYITCLTCKEIRTAFGSGGFNYGALWDDLNDFGFENMNDSCFLKLQTVAAKKFLRERWMKWKGLQA